MGHCGVSRENTEENEFLLPERIASHGGASRHGFCFSLGPRIDFVAFVFSRLASRLFDFSTRRGDRLGIKVRMNHCLFSIHL